MTRKVETDASLGSVTNDEEEADFKGVFPLIISRRVVMRKRVVRRVSRLERGKVKPGRMGC